MEDHKENADKVGDNNVKKVEIFSTPTCHFCHDAKDWFNENGVEYIDHDVSVKGDELARMMEITGQRGVPVIIVGNDVIIGFNQPKLAELLDIK